MLMKFLGAEARYLPGLGTVLNPGDTVNVPDHLVEQHKSALLAPVKSEAPEKGRTKPAVTEETSS